MTSQRMMPPSMFNSDTFDLAGSEGDDLERFRPFSLVAPPQTSKEVRGLAP